MLFYNDGFRILTGSTFSLFLEISHLMLTLCQPIATGCIYEKYYQNALNETYATVYASMGIQSVLECERICLEHGFGCVGANVFTGGKHHVCSLFSEIRTPISEDVLITNRNGKLIVKIKGLCNDGSTWKFRKSSYCFNQRRVNQTHAALYCKSIGAQLISIETKGEFDYIRQKLTSAATGNTWVSARQARNGIGFWWASGMELPKKSIMWAPGEPSGVGRCVNMWSAREYKFDDYLCNNKETVLCEIWLK